MIHLKTTHELSSTWLVPNLHLLTFLVNISNISDFFDSLILANSVAERISYEGVFF